MKNLVLYKNQFFRINIISLFYILISIGSNGLNESGNLFYDTLNSFYFIYFIESLVSILLLFIPFIMIIASLSDVFVQYITIESNYCFTRERKVLRWYVKKCLLLAVYTFYSTGFIFIISLTANIVIGKHSLSDLFGALLPCASVFLISWLFLYLFSLLLNIISFYIPPKWSMPLIMIVLFGCFINMKQTNHSDLYIGLLNPAVHFYFRIHNEYNYLVPESAATAGVSMLTVRFSLLYFAAAIILTLVIGYRRIRKYEFGLLKEA